MSAPIVPFRETIIDPPKIDMVNEAIQDSNVVGKTSKMKEFEDDKEVCTCTVRLVILAVTVLV